MKKSLVAVLLCAIACIPLRAQTFSKPDDFDRSEYQNVIYPCDAESIHKKTGNVKYSFMTEIWQESSTGGIRTFRLNSGDPVGLEMSYDGKKLPDSVMPAAGNERKAIRAYFRIRKDDMTDEYLYTIDAVEIMEHRFYPFCYYRCEANLWLRSSPGTGGEKVRLMEKGTDLKVIEVGPAQTIDGIPSFWVKVRKPGSEADFDGWCFGGYLYNLGL